MRLAVSIASRWRDFAVHLCEAGQQRDHFLPVPRLQPLQHIARCRAVKGNQRRAAVEFKRRRQPLRVELEVVRRALFAAPQMMEALLGLTPLRPGAMWTRQDAALRK